MPMADDDVAFAGVAAQARMVQAGEVHPRELVELALARIEAIDPGVNAFRVVMADEALAAAAEAPDGPLRGVPVAVKDDQAVAGQATTFGSRAATPVQAADGEVVRRLRAAGAIPVGITNVPELMIFPWTATAANGITRNPFDRTRTPGGSSGGSAAAVAAGMVAAATASDGAGSIRIPAACCGLVGMKPSRGRVSLAPRAEGWLGLSTFGALTRTVADSALMLDVLAGTVPTDRDRLDPPSKPYLRAATTPPAAPLRIAVSTAVPAGVITKVDPERATAAEATGALAESLGHRVIARDPDYGLVGVTVLRAYLGGIAGDLDALPRGGPFEPTTARMAAAGRRLLPASKRATVRDSWRRPTARLLVLWRDIDVLVTPALASAPLPAEGGYGQPTWKAMSMATAFTPWTAMWNLTGQPALTLPVGGDADGLPVAVQLVGAPGREDQLYALAGQLEAARPWADRRPSLP